jgi:hypothetical protein
MQEEIAQLDGTAEAQVAQQTGALEDIILQHHWLSFLQLVSDVELAFSAPLALPTTLFLASLVTNARTWPLLSLALLDTFKI